ncbi:hypothetical protein HIM_07589 [Hirsutella minnesotensis 3608]|uniref:Tyrosinase copper-binding domain-containing protein n=1 Tax=Hirsutella minnesotensis 3608 TaxID=1043627 RepID=A0A0F7ZYT2_9HYPO|nr:hypothetical protein HIM_07589 [Hirsutella minnesotensis 3608]
MVLRLLLCTLGASLVLAQATGYDFGTDISHLSRRQDGTAPIVIGKLPLAPDGSVPKRLEIRQMKADRYKWDLFILALSLIQFVGQDDPLSWYQIAGIHGVPFKPWNGVLPVQGGGQSGYCTHNSVLFPMWHRPYMALFEQQVFRMANGIAGMFVNETQRRLYQQAAADFRVPYWDWSRNAPPGDTHLPGDFWKPVIAQDGPNGVQNINNPLYSYHFHPLDMDALIWDPLKQWNETKRGPDLGVSLTAPPSDNGKVNEALLTKLPEIQQRLYVLFSNYHDYNSFSNKAWAVSNNLSTLDSIESVHDVIHLYGGSKGHLTYVPLSSFDPLFFLHHAMTDRLVAIWQVLNPTAWITPMPAGETTFTALKGTIQSSSSPLTPFYASSDGTFWTSDSARSTEAFGYTYADTDPALGSSQDIRQALIAKINDWYGSASPMGNLVKAQDMGASDESQQHPWNGPLKEDGRLGSHVKLKHEQTLQDNRYTEWIANVHVNAEALNGSFVIHFFIGAPPINEDDWETAPNLGGSVGIFAMNRTTGSQFKISGAVPLTAALMRSTTGRVLADLSPEVMVPTLRESLQFRILGSDGHQVDPSSVRGLYIAVSSSNVKPPKTLVELPVWGPVEPRLELWA